MSLTIGAAMLLGYLAFTQLRARRAADASLAERIRLDEALGLFPGILRNLDGRIIAWGQGAERLYGYPAAQAIGRLSHSLLQTEFPCPLGEIEAALLHDGLWRGELVHRHRDGSRLVIASHWALRPAGKRGPALVIEVNNDITALRQADAAIRESEERLRAATEAAGVGLVLVNREHRYRFANKAYADILELPSHDIVGQRVADVLTSMYADQIRPRLLRAFEGDRVVYELTRPAIPRHQAERHYAVTYELSRVAADEPVVVVVITEITERIAATHALLDRERMLQLALEASDLGIWRCETAQTGGTLDWDARCKAIFGFPTEHPVTFDAWKNAVPEDEWDIVEAELTRTLSPDDPRDDYACAYPVRRPDGALRWVAAVGRTFFEPDVKAPSGRRAVRIIGTMRDVTEARRDEQERQRNDELLRTILSTAPGLIYAKDWAGRFLVANEPVHALYGKPWADMQGRTDRQILNNSAESEALMQTDRRVMAAGATEVVEELFGEDDGLARVWLSTKTPLRSADGRIVGIVGVSLEITERKRYENRLQLMVHELNHRVKNTLATIQAIAAHSLRQADTSIRQTFENRLLALSAAHDVLTRESWAGASINEVVAAALAPFGGSDSSRFQVVGPELRLLPRAALALSMGLHELATNAAKYGALLCDAGTVTVQWSIRDGRLRLVWSEQGGPVVLPASRCGFGMRLVERSVARDLGGTAVISFEPDGIYCSIEAPLESIASSAQVLWLPDVGNTSAR
jgi:PAS domain S-box-containing protein